MAPREMTVAEAMAEREGARPGGLLAAARRAAEDAVRRAQGARAGERDDPPGGPSFAGADDLEPLGPFMGMEWFACRALGQELAAAPGAPTVRDDDARHVFAPGTVLVEAGAEDGREWRVMRAMGPLGTLASRVAERARGRELGARRRPDRPLRRAAPLFAARLPSAIPSPVPPAAGLMVPMSEGAARAVAEYAATRSAPGPGTVLVPERPAAATVATYVAALQRRGARLWATPDGRLVLLTGRAGASVREAAEAFAPLIGPYLAGRPRRCELPHEGEPPEATDLLDPGGVASCADHATGALPVA